MSSFSGVPFRVKIDDKMYPPVFMDSEGINRYKATVFLANRTNVETMHALQSVATFRRALGSKPGTTRP